MPLQQRGGGHDHPGGAISALIGAFFEEGLLDGREGAVLLQAFNGDDLCASGGRGRSETGACGTAIQQDGTGTALAFAAAEFCAGEAEPVTQNPEQRLIVSGPHPLLRSIDV